MEVYLRPDVIRRAMQRTGCKSAEAFGQKFLDVSGMTVRNYLKGKSTPSVATVAKVAYYAKTPLAECLDIYHDNGEQVAA